MKKSIVAFITLLLLSACISLSQAKTADNICQQAKNLSFPLTYDSFVNIIKENKPSVVYITSKIVQPSSLQIIKGFWQTAHGTGFIIEDEGILVITNRHVVENASEIELEITLGDQKQKVKAEIAHISARTDIAILKIQNAEISGQAKPLKLGDSDLAREGEFILVIGNPYGFTGTSSIGIISCIREENTLKNETEKMFPHKLFQMDMAINPGNSGSPLLDIKGEAIGIVVAIVSGAQGIAFAIPINLAKEEILEMKTKQK